MRRGNFQAMGQELVARSNPLSIWGVAIFAFLVFVLLWLTLAKVSLLASSIFDFANIGAYLFLIGIPVAVALIIICRFQIARFSRIRLLDVTYSDERDENGELVIEFKDTTNNLMQPVKLVVKRVKVRPKNSLTIFTWGPRSPNFNDRKTVCSLDIISKTGPRNLRLGFSSVGELEKINSELNRDGVRTTLD